jgi:hypothetical protein
MKNRKPEHSAFRRTVAAIAMVAIVALFASCLPGDGKNSAEKPANFLTGIWHGWIAPISVIVGIFDKNIRVYEPNNTGWWYDFGFYMAVVSGFGGLAVSRKAKKRNQG